MKVCDLFDYCRLLYRCELPEFIISWPVIHVNRTSNIHRLNYIHQIEVSILQINTYIYLIVVNCMYLYVILCALFVRAMLFEKHKTSML